MGIKSIIEIPKKNLRIVQKRTQLIPEMFVKEAKDSIDSYFLTGEVMG